MAWRYPSWLTHLALADGPGPACTFIGHDRISMPLLARQSPDRFQATETMHTVVETDGGGRFFRTAPPLETPVSDTGPVVLLTDHMAPDQIVTVMETLSVPPTALLHVGQETPLSGYQLASPLLPGLLTPPEGAAFAQALEQIAAEHCRAGRDGFDALEAICETSRHLRRIQFHADGDALIGLSPVSLVRNLDPSSGQRLMFAGAVHLQRWRPVTLRVPVFGLTDPEIHIRLSDASGLETLRCERIGRGGLSSMPGAKSGGNSLWVKPAGPPRLTVDLELAGHDTRIESIAVRLTALTPQEPDANSDPLEHYADPLAHYG